MTPIAALGPAELLQLFANFMFLSMLSVGGAITTTAEMHRYLAVQHQWITDTQFSSSIAIAQAAPGPNILFVAVLGWNVAGPLGALATMAGMLLPSTTLAFVATRWGRARRETRGVRAFTQGMAPLILGLLIATGWVLSTPYVQDPASRIMVLLLLAVTVGVMLKTRISPMWLVLAGGVLGALGWV
jgi:chromate transporter